MGVNLAGTLNNLPGTVQSPGTTVTPTIPYDPATRSFTMTNSSVDGRPWVERRIRPDAARSSDPDSASPARTAAVAGT